MREDEQSEPLEICWRPSRAIVEQSNLARFIARNGLRSFEELLGWSVADVGRFWDAVVRDLGLEWYEPYTKVLDLSRGTPWATWWIGARFNYVHNALDRHAAGANRDKVALIWEGEDGKTARLTYGQLAAETGRCANALRALGLKKGDRVGLLLPMIPEVVVAQLAIGKLGAVFTPIFSGFGPEAVAARLQDCDARVLITCDGIERRGKLVPIKEVADRAVALSPSVEKVLVVNRLRRADVPWDPGRDLWWHELLAGQPAGADTERTAPEDPHMIIYTSGTTGRPKGVVHVQGGFPIKGVQDMAHCFDVKPSDTVFWFTDMGWMMGPWVISGSLMLGATVFLYDGTPDFPDPGRVWEMVERHRLTVVGIAPTAIRALMRAGDDWVTRRDLSSLRVLGSSGEPWNPDAWRWFQGVVGGGRCPVVNYSGGTEVSGGIVASTVITPQKPASFAGPVPGMDADVVDESGTPVRGSVGELVVRQPWPGMARGFWRERERYLEAYWSRLPGTWVHGDWAQVAADGFWYIHGRSDDTIKIAGKRLGPAEVESAAVTHPAVAEAAAIGVPHEIKGQALVVFCTLKAAHRESDALRRAVADAVAASLGKSLTPERVLFVGELPKTRSGKVMRRLIRAVHLGKEPGDLSGLENDAALDAIRAAR
ncbi:MAG: AMP-dependent synthetase [Candidatus Rokuibacteriota bacterium]|nr:MAG: AMP-dependent synthetase [Candidatus Rokubacteria bacterium]